MPPNRYRGPPMTLANMRAQGVRSLWAVDAKTIFEHLAQTGRPGSGLRYQCFLGAGQSPHS